MPPLTKCQSAKQLFSKWPTDCVDCRPNDVWSNDVKLSQLFQNRKITRVTKTFFFFKTLIFSEMSFFSILFRDFFAKVSLKWSKTQKDWVVTEKWAKNKLVAPSAIPTKSFSSCGSHSICNSNNLVDYRFAYQERDTDFF